VPLTSLKKSCEHPAARTFGQGNFLHVPNTPMFASGCLQGSCPTHQCSVCRPAAYCHHWHGALAGLLQMDELECFESADAMANSAGEIAPPPFGTKYERGREPAWALYDALHVALRGLPEGVPHGEGDGQCRVPALQVCPHGTTPPVSRPWERPGRKREKASEATL